jgi:UDP-N-acetylglucosamine--N-acetylmuramyl-(pentapeptide) pyrophosphoryl-undecaprenol N-acetylglucosamine transferase
LTVILFAGGGTGGHLMPALAIAEAMVEADPSIEPYFVGAHRGIEARILPARPWRHTLLPFEPIYRRQWWRNVSLPLALWRSVRGIRQVLERERPALAIGTGGYASGPALWVASRMGIPTVIQEQNAFPGLSTRRLARQARQIHLGFPEARAFIRPGAGTQVFDSGNPISGPPRGHRPAAGGGPQRLEAKRSLGFEPGRPLVLVTGGSQGARPINLAVAEALEGGRWPEGVQLLWQTGAAGFDEFSARAGSREPSSVRASAFLDPIAPAYDGADLVVSRAGAMTLAEVAAWGLPSVLIPLPTAAANHQLGNARATSESGAAALLEQHNLTGQTLGALVGRLLGDPAGLAVMASASLARARPLAAQAIAGEALRLLSRA